MRIIKVASLIGFLLVILVGCTKDVPTPEPELGVVNGVVLDSVANDQGIDFALQGLGNTKVELFRDGLVQQSTLTDPEGNSPSKI